MTSREILQQALGKLRRRFPSALPGINSLPDRDWHDEESWIEVLHTFIDSCKNEKLNKCYAHHVNSLHEKEHGISAGIGMVKGSLELRCRALIQALQEAEDLANKQ